MDSLKTFPVNPIRMHIPEALHFSDPPSSNRIGERHTHAPYPRPPCWSSIILYKCFTSAHLALAVLLLCLWSFRPMEDSMEPVESALMRYGWHFHL